MAARERCRGRRIERGSSTMKKSPKRESLPLCAVMLAGGRGTRFWPRSRMRTPKQLLNITGGETMLRETVARLESGGAAEEYVGGDERRAGRGGAARDARGGRVAHSRGACRTQYGRGDRTRRDASAHEHGDALMAVLPSDSYIAGVAAYRKLVRAALKLAQTPGNLVVLGVPPTRPETGYGYIEKGALSPKLNGVEAYVLRRFTEKPERSVAQEYVASGKYFWNAGMFFWRVSTFLDNLKKFLPETHDALQALGKTIGTKRYAAALRKIYPKLKSISVDYAIMEPATPDRRRAPRVRDPGGGWLERHWLVGGCL